MCIYIYIPFILMSGDDDAASNKTRIKVRSYPVAAAVGSAADLMAYCRSSRRAPRAISLGLGWHDSRPWDVVAAFLYAGGIACVAISVVSLAIFPQRRSDALRTLQPEGAPEGRAPKT